MHIGSGTDFQHLSRVSTAMEQAATQVGGSVRSISAGGGLPVPYRDGERPIDLDAYYTVWHATRTRLAQRFGHGVRLEIEPGRYLVAESGYLICEIRAVKQMGQNTFYLVDAGFNNLADRSYTGPTIRWQSRRRRGRPRTVRWDQLWWVGHCVNRAIFSLRKRAGSSHRANCPRPTLATCWSSKTSAPYGFVMSSNYCSKTKCAEVLLDGGRVHGIRARQTLDDLIRGETIPAAQSDHAT